MSVLDAYDEIKVTVMRVLSEYPNEWVGAEELYDMLRQAGVLKDPATEHADLIAGRAEAVRRAADALPDDAPYPKEWLRNWSEVIEGRYEG